MSDIPPLHKVIDDVRESTGARMIVLGEVHTQTDNIQYIRDSLKEMKEKGISTLYVEMPADTQPLLEKALKGDEDAQRDLRLKKERWWGSYSDSEAAQQRYDLLFEANKAGMRVKAIDVESNRDHMDRYNNDMGKEDLTARLAIGDPVMARNIQRADDGKGAIFLVGAYHTYQHTSEKDGHTEYGGTVFQSQHGGVDQRLKALGIPTASVDFVPSDGPHDIGVAASDGNRRDYEIIMPFRATPEKPDYHASTGHRVYWDRLANIYEHASDQAVLEGNSKLSKDLDGVSKDVRGLSKMLDDPKFLKNSPEDQAQKIQQEVERINKHVEGKIEPFINDELLLNASVTTRAKWMAPTDPANPDATWKALIKDNIELHKPEAAAMWKRPGMPLAGETLDATKPNSGLQQSWKTAQAATKPLQTSAPEAAPQASTPAAANSYKSEYAQESRREAYEAFSNNPDLQQNWQVAQQATTPLQTSVPAPDVKPDVSPETQRPKTQQSQGMAL